MYVKYLKGDLNFRIELILYQRHLRFFEVCEFSVKMPLIFLRMLFVNLCNHFHVDVIINNHIGIGGDGYGG